RPLRHVGLHSTPARLQMFLVVLLAVTLLATTAVGVAAYQRRAALDALSQRSEPTLVGSERLYASLADADATETSSFLVAGIESVDRRGARLARHRHAPG